MLYLRKLRSDYEKFLAQKGSKIEREKINNFSLVKNGKVVLSLTEKKYQVIIRIGQGRRLIIDAV